MNIPLLFKTVRTETIGYRHIMGHQNNRSPTHSLPTHYRLSYIRIVNIMVLIKLEVVKSKQKQTKCPDTR